jgi:uncharacterized membrane protein
VRVGQVLPVLLGLMLLASSAAHQLTPEAFDGFIPDAIPGWFAHLVATVLEAGVGGLLLNPTTRRWGGLAFAGLMLGFLPMHVWDLFQAEPVIGPSPMPQIRLVMQFVLIGAGLAVWRLHDTDPTSVDVS